MSRFLIITLTILISSCSYLSGPQITKNKSVEIFDSSNSKPVMSSNISKLDDEEKAALAYLSAQINTECKNGSCELTKALGFEKQCGKEHIAFIKEYFDDFRKSDCNYMPDDSVSYTWYNEIKFNRLGEYMSFENQISWVVDGKESSEKEIRKFEIADGKVSEQKLLSNYQY